MDEGQKRQWDDINEASILEQQIMERERIIKLNQNLQILCDTIEAQKTPENMDTQIEITGPDEQLAVPNGIAHAAEEINTGIHLGTHDPKTPLRPP